MTVFNFTPSAQTPYQFSPELDGAQYNAIVKWNLEAQRWYLQLFTLGGTLVFNQALVGSPTGVNIQAVEWSRGQVTVTTADPHNYNVLDTIDLTISGMLPAALNGKVSAFVINTLQFTFALADDPGPATVLGSVAYNIDMAQGYFTSSSLVYREASNQFEVAP